MAKPGPKPRDGALQREPKRNTRPTLSQPKLGGVEHARELVSDYGGIHRVAEDLQLSVDLVNHYVSGQVEPPYVFLCALWWHTSHGFQQAFSEAHWTHQFNSFKRREAEEKAASLERVLQHAVRLLEHRTDAQSLLREAIDSALLLAEQGVPARGELVV